MSEVNRFKMEFQPSGDVRECVYACDYDAAQSELAALREELSGVRSLLCVMTSDYACCLEAGFDRITALGGDCDSVEKMLRDNPNHAKAIAACANPTESGASDAQ